MNWSRVPSLPIPGGDITHPAKSAYVSEGGAFRVTPTFARDRRGRRLKRTAWRLLEGNRQVGQSFYTAKLAKAFAEALDALGNDPGVRREFIRNGAAWCSRWERESRSGDSAATPFVWRGYRSALRHRILVFKWWGGAYIDVGFVGRTPFEVINVWDDEKDVPKIARTQAAFERRCNEWLSDPDLDLSWTVYDLSA